MNSTRSLFGLVLALVLAGQTSCTSTRQADADSAPLAKLRAQAEQGEATAQNELGNAYRLGKLGLATNYVEALKWLRKAAEQNHPTAQNSLGVCYYRGWGVEREFSVAVKWYRKAAEQNNAAAQNNLGWCHLVGEGVATNYVEAMKWLHKAGEQNYNLALINLGNCYSSGHGVSKDDVEALKWYRQAAERNDPWGQYNLGRFYAQGIGVAKDEDEALAWLRKAAEQKNDRAQSYLEWFCAMGEGLAQDGTKLYKWDRPAAAPVDPTARRTLTGAVQDERDQPLSNATVFIYTAAPKQGAGVLCPSCYADCRKRATTDRDGKFTIPSLDPELLFRLLVVGKDRQPAFVPAMDPAEKSVVVTLKPKLGGETPDKRLQGQVVNGEGKPIAGAVINIRGVTRGRSTRFGGNTKIDPVAVSDDSGQFLINGREPFTAAFLEVEARGSAKRIFQNLATGVTNHTLQLTAGVTLKGRVVKNGEPLAGIEIGVAGADRSGIVYVGDFSVATDQAGWFLFANLPPHTDYFLYGMMKSLGDRGSIPAQRVRTEDDDSTLDVGDLKVQPAFTVAGQIRLTDGKPLPANLRALLSCEDAWDSQQAELDNAGRFRFTGVPPASVNVSAGISRYRFSLRNASLDPLNPFRLVGRINTNKTDLLLEFEPGERHDSFEGDSSAMRKSPLRGAEAVKPSADDIKVTGTVIDAETQKPVPSFAVTEGRKDQIRDRIDWMTTRKSAHSNGAFTVYFTKQRQAPAVLIEADGYFPKASGLIGTNGTNIVMALKKGSGFAGVVLKPDGQPATNTAVYLTDLKNGIHVGDQNLIVREAINRGTRSTRTDDKGHFSFSPQIDAFSILILADAGYAEVPVGRLEKTPEVRLQPYARIEGQLMIGRRLGANETIRLGIAYSPYAELPGRIRPPLNLFLTTSTDANGKFVFEQVPPIAVEVYHEPKVRDSRDGLVPQSQTTRFLLKSGEKRQLVLGGKGRPVIGRLVANGYDGKIDYRVDVQSIESIPSKPADVPDLTAMTKEYSLRSRSLENDEAKKSAGEEYNKQRKAAEEKLRAFYQTEAGQQYLFAKRRFALNFSQDGSFRIEDVPGGKYNLRIDLREGSGDMLSRFSSPVIASLTREIEVPDLPGGRSDKPFDLGKLEVTGRSSLKTGKPAPDFEVRSLDGKPLKLADFKGKYLLLDFWAVWCGPCVAETPHLKAVWDAFKGNPRFAMVGLSLDPDVAAPRTYTAKNEIGWTQGFLGDWSKSDVPERFGVQGIPSIFLIDPDGKIIAKGMRGEAIKTAVQAALQKQTSTLRGNKTEASPPSSANPGKGPS